MINEAIINKSKIFIQKLTHCFKEYPGISIGIDWPSMGAIDVMLYHLRYRKDWNKKEKDLFDTMCSLIGILTYNCWKTFHKNVELHANNGIECIAILKNYIIQKQTYSINITEVLQNIIQEPKNPMPVLGKQFVMASDKTNFTTMFGLGACLGMSSYGKGLWAEKLPGDLANHIQKTIPYLAETTCEYYKRVYGDDAALNKSLFENHLIWPPAGYHGDCCGSTAAEGILEYESEHGQKLSLETLINLSKMPNETISSGATILCVARMSGKNITRDLIEHYFNIISPNAGSIRHVANELSLKSGKDLDWLRTKDIERFKFEKRIWLLPILHLRFETCIKSEMKELTEALIHINIDKAKELIEDYVNEGPEYLFQKAMLFKVQHDYEKAEYLFDHIEKRYPEYSYGEYLNERGMNFLNLKNTTKAIHMLSRAVEIDDLNGRAISNLGWAFLSSSQYDKAKPILDKAIHKSDMIVTSLLNRSHLFYEIGENNFAEEDLKKAVNLCPYDRRCVNNVIKKYYDIS